MVLFYTLTSVECVTLADVIYQRLRDILADQHLTYYLVCTFPYTLLTLLKIQLASLFLFSVNIALEAGRIFF